MCGADVCADVILVSVPGWRVSARQIAGKLEKHKKFYFSSTTFTTVFKICLYARCFDSSVCPHKIFWWHFANSSKLLKNHFVNELDLTSFKFAAIKWFFKSLEESAKCHQKILRGHTDESKCLAYGHILKTVVKVMEEKFNFLCFLKLDSSSSVYMQSATLISSCVCSCVCLSVFKVVLWQKFLGKGAGGRGNATFSHIFIIPTHEVGKI